MRMNIRYFLEGLLIACSICCMPAKAAEAGTDGSLPAPLKVAFIVPSGATPLKAEMNDVASLKASLSAAGIRFDEITVCQVSGERLKPFAMLILPYAASKELDAAADGAVKQAVSAGATVVFDGPAGLAAELGIGAQEKEITVEKVRDAAFPDIPVDWVRPAGVRPVEESEGYRTLCSDEKSGEPLAVAGTFGKGKYIYFAPLFDPESCFGYDRFPFLLETLSRERGLPAMARRSGVIMYFDPGSNPGADVDALATVWRERGVSRIYSGGYHRWLNFTYNYADLIRACHENGIQVYCWLEPPMVTPRFWEQHPEWREKTALLRDAKVDWRQLMNLADPDCRRAAFSEVEQLLLENDWDGVDLAELYFEPTGGPVNPASFTPMNDLVRKDFREKHGFDPLEIFDPAGARYWKTEPASWKLFAAYRRDLCNTLKTQYVDFLAAVQKKKKKDFEIVITAIDTSLLPELEDNIAEDPRYLMSLQKKYGLTVQIEDSWLSWADGPDRYAKLGDTYRRYIAKGVPMEFDCNIVQRYDSRTNEPSRSRQTGEEVRQIVAAIDRQGVRPVLYAEATIYEHDLANITAALARETVITADKEGWRIRAPRTVTVPAAGIGLVAVLDGTVWPAGSGERVIVPAGEHTLGFAAADRCGKAVRSMPHLLSINGELEQARFRKDRVDISYASPRSRCYVRIDREPEAVRIDGRRVSCQVFESSSGYALQLPAGSHRVAVTTEE